MALSITQARETAAETLSVISALWDLPARSAARQDILVETWAEVILGAQYPAFAWPDAAKLIYKRANGATTPPSVAQVREALGHLLSSPSYPAERKAALRSFFQALNATYDRENGGAA